MSLADVAALLTCPVCTGPLQLHEAPARLQCGQQHSFDVARQGYVNLARSAAPANADTAAMVAARQRFLDRGRYRQVVDAVVTAAAPAGPRAVLDCGAGTGYYLAQLLGALPAARGLALDISPAAARRAAGAHPRIGAMVADAWQRLPVADACLDAVLSVFAPRRADELHRVLQPHGQLLTVTPTERHLGELRAELPLLEIQPHKQDRLAQSLAGHFWPGEEEEVAVTEPWDAETVRDAVGMGPNAFHADTDRGLTEALARLTGTRPVTVAVRVSRWRPRS